MFLSYFYLPIGYLVKTKNTTSLEHNSHVPPSYSWNEIDYRVRAAYHRALTLGQ